MKWIKLSDQRPPDNRNVLVYAKSKKYIAIIYGGNLNIFCYLAGYDSTTCDDLSPRLITHWLPFENLNLPLCEKCDTSCIKCSEEKLLEEMRNMEEAD